MTQNNKHINEENFRKYLEGEMTSAERNLFERELQKHPFEAEAMEGFEAVPSISFESDVTELKERITTNKKRKNYRYWAAAATILLVVTAGVIWIQLDDRHSVQKVAEIKTLQKHEEKMVSSEPNKEILQESQIIQPQATDKFVEEKGESKKVAGVSVGKKSKISPPIQNMNKNIQLTELNIADEEIDSSVLKVEEDQEIIVAREFHQTQDSNTLFMADGVERTKSINTSAASFSSVQKNKAAADSFAEGQGNVERMIVAAPKSAKKLDSTIKADSKALPKNGMVEFEKYLEKEAVLPADFRKRKESVQLLLKINLHGDIVKIENTNKADSTVFEHAKQIIHDGPAWNPEIKNGIPIDSEIEITIAFRKTK